MTFTLHPNLAKKDVIADLPLSRVLLIDNKDYPWILLVPRKKDVKKILDLDASDQAQLMTEIVLASGIMQILFKPDQQNIAAIGIKTPQLHVHVIARFETDPGWPNTVWELKGTPYEPDNKASILARLTQAFSERMPS